MKKLLISSILISTFAIGQMVVNGTLGIKGHLNINVTPQAPFNTLPIVTTEFTPQTISGFPCASTTTGAFDKTTPCPTGYLPALSWQGGDYIDGYVIFAPWVVSGTLNTSQIINGVLLWYQPSLGDFSNKSAWGFYDMQTASGYSSCPNTPGSTTTYCPASYNSDIIVGNTLYLVPDFQNQHPVFALVNVGGTGGLANTANYSFVSGSAITLGSGAKGWATGIYDGSRYIYYSPTVQSTKLLQHDTSLDTGGSLSSSGWTVVDYNATCSLGDQSYLGSVYDGHKYAYFIPGTGAGNGIPPTTIMRLDTTASFACGALSTLDLATLGQSGKPIVTLNNAKLSNFLGFAGGVIGTSGNTTNGIEYLYLVPTSTFKTSFSNLTLGSTTGRVAIGTWTNGTFTPLDAFSTGANWQLFDLSSLAFNPSYTVNGWVGNPGRLHVTTSGLDSQSNLAGWQLGWTDNITGRVGFGASFGKFVAEHDPNHAINDPAGWWLGLTSPDMGVNDYGIQSLYQGGGLSNWYPSGAIPTVMLQYSGL